MNVEGAPPGAHIAAFWCGVHRLGWATELAARDHDRECGRVRALTLDELQGQMDAADAALVHADSDVAMARSRIAEASSDHRAVRLIRDAAKERSDLARRLWAERAGDYAKRILKGDR